MDNQALSKRYRLELSSVKDLLFYFLIVWTGVILAFAWLSFFISRFAISEAFVTSYITLLGVYITHKEVSRWTGVQMKIRPGELMVYIWWFSLLAMLFFGFFLHREVSGPIRQIAYDVLGAFLASEISKGINAYRKNKLAERKDDQMETKTRGRLQNPQHA